MTTSSLPVEQPYEFASIAEELSERYKILKQIGKGGNGVVYLALDQFEQRKVAIKVAHVDEAEQCKGKRYRLWMNEIRMAGQLKHPFIIDTYEAGVIKAGGYYIVMEYLSGGTLKPFIEPDKLLPYERVVEVLFKVCKALEYVYSMGILHRDIKPGNILLNQNGDIKVADFGSCYQTNSTDSQVLDIGTFDYVPPEQFKNAAPNVQFDIYATGLMAYQLLTGHVPFTGDSSESLIYQKLYVDPPPLSEWRPDIPARLSEVVLRAIARDPAQRYSEWKTFSNDLEGALSSSHSSSGITNDSSKYGALSRLEFFREFNQKELWEVVQISAWIRYKPGDAVVSEGDACSSLYVIIVGSADVLKGNVKINHMMPGSCFGELSYLDQAIQLRTTGVVASTILVVLCIDGERLRKASDGLHARFSRALLKGMISKKAQYDKHFIAMAEQITSSQKQQYRTSTQARKPLYAATKLDSTSALQIDSGSVRLQLHSGDALQIQDANMIGQKYNLKFIGSLKGESILLTLPLVDGHVLLMPKGHSYIMRGFDGKYAYAFTTQVIKARSHPFPYVHFSYPHSVEHKIVRKALRVSVKIPVAVTGESVLGEREQIQATMINLSARGAMIHSPQSVGEIGNLVQLQFEVAFEEINATLTLAARIRNLHYSEDENSLYIGVEFESIPQNDMLMLNNFILATSIDEVGYH